jgi:hypothetical protein
MDSGPRTLDIRVSSLACEVDHVLLAAIIIVDLRLCISSTNVIIGTMMDREVIWRRQKYGAWMIMSL